MYGGWRYSHLQIPTSAFPFIAIHGLTTSMKCKWGGCSTAFCPSPSSRRVCKNKSACVSLQRIFYYYYTKRGGSKPHLPIIVAEQRDTIPRSHWSSSTQYPMIINGPRAEVDGWRRNCTSNKNTLIEVAFNLIVMPLVAQWTRRTTSGGPSRNSVNQSKRHRHRHLCQLDINRSKWWWWHLSGAEQKRRLQQEEKVNVCSASISWYSEESEFLALQQWKCSINLIESMQPSIKKRNNLHFSVPSSLIPLVDPTDRPSVTLSIYLLLLLTTSSGDII